MAVNPRPRNDSRALARELAELRRRGEAALRRRANVPNVTPPPVDVAPTVGSLVEWLLEHENREPQ